MYKEIVILLGFFVLVFSSCKERETVNVEHQIVNDTFLQIMDTVSYHYTSLRPPPPPYDAAYSRTESIAGIQISVHTRFLNIYTREADIMLALKGINDSSAEQYAAFSRLLSSNKTDSSSHEIRTTKITNTGKYVLVPVKDQLLEKGKGFIGHINFSRIINNGNIGLMIVSIQDNLKSGIEKLVLVERNNSRWIIVKELELGV